MRNAARAFATVALGVASDLHAFDPEGFPQASQDELLDAANLAVFCHKVEAREPVDCVRSVDGFRWCGDRLQKACSGTSVSEELTKRHVVTCKACWALAERS